MLSDLILILQLKCEILNENMKSAAVVNYAPLKGSVEIREVDRAIHRSLMISFWSGQCRSLRQRFTSMDCRSQLAC
jgi:hypothetical protein